MVVGDLVRHNTFPPIEGVVAVIEPSEFMTRVAVLRTDTNTLIWDTDNTWDVIGNIEELTSSINEVDIIGTPIRYDEVIEENIIDGEFREIE